MASFIRRLFGGGEPSTPAQAPTPAPAAPTPAPAAPVAATKEIKSAVRGTKKTVYTGPLGLSEEERSRRALKYLTGQ
jgi:hypothetical protein